MNSSLRRHVTAVIWNLIESCWLSSSLIVIVRVYSLLRSFLAPSELTSMLHNSTRRFSDSQPRAPRKNYQRVCPMLHLPLQEWIRGLCAIRYSFYEFNTLSTFLNAWNRAVGTNKFQALVTGVDAESSPMDECNTRLNTYVMTCISLGYAHWTLVFRVVQVVTVTATVGLFNWK